MTGSSKDRLAAAAIMSLTLISIMGIVAGVIVAWLDSAVGAVVAVVSGAVGGIVAIVLRETAKSNGHE